MYCWNLDCIKICFAFSNKFGYVKQALFKDSWEPRRFWRKRTQNTVVNFCVKNVKGKSSGCYIAATAEALTDVCEDIVAILIFVCSSKCLPFSFMKHLKSCVITYIFVYKESIQRIVPTFIWWENVECVCLDANLTRHCQKRGAKFWLFATATWTSYSRTCFKSLLGR